MKYHKTTYMMVLGGKSWPTIDDVWISVREGIIGFVELRPWI